MPLEPLRRAAREAIVGPLGDHQVRVGILPLRTAPVEGERVGQPFLVGQLRREALGHLPPRPKDALQELSG